MRVCENKSIYLSTWVHRFLIITSGVEGGFEFSKGKYIWDGPLNYLQEADQRHAKTNTSGPKVYMRTYNQEYLPFCLHVNTDIDCKLL